MKMKMALAAAIIAVSAGNALAAAARIDFISLGTGFPVPTGCTMAVTFSPVKLNPSDPESLAAAKPIGSCPSNGNAMGARGTATVNGESGNFLTLGQTTGSRKTSLLYVIQLNSRRRLESGLIWALFDTMDGKTVNIIDGGVYTVQ